METVLSEKEKINTKKQIKVKFCKKCVMPNTRPGITFNEEGICSACQAYLKIQETDWNKRFEELKKLCDKYRGSRGKDYDCLIAASGGKDSHYQVYIMKEVMKMNPLLVTVEDNFTVTEAGKHNIQNISREFSCDIVALKPNAKIQQRLTRKFFEKYLKPTWYVDRLIYTYPLYIAARFNIPLLVYGENVNYIYGGHGAIDTYSAKEQIHNGVAIGMPKEELLDDVVTENAISFLDPPSPKELDKLEPIYLSYFLPWNSYQNYLFAKQRGFRDLTHEWRREHHCEDFNQIDTMGYIVHAWLKYPKFGHATTTDLAARMVRYGLMTRDEAVALVKKHDHRLDSLALQDFLRFTGYSTREFWDALEKFWNRDLFVKVGTEWKLKHTLDNTGVED